MPFKQKALAHIKVGSTTLSLGQVYEGYFHRIYAYIASHLENQNDVEDVVSDVFLKVTRNFAQFRGENLSSWLFTVAHNALQDKHRKRQPEQIDLEDDIAIDAESPEQSLITHERQIEILTYIRSLSTRRQEVITLKFYGQLRNQEIAEVLGINEQSVASHLHRALADLRRLVVLDDTYQLEEK